MNLGQLVPSLLSGTIVVLVTTPAICEEILSIELKNKTASTDKSVSSTRQAPQVTKAQPVEPTRKIRLLSEIERPLKSAQMLLVQSPAPQTGPAREVVQVTSVKANPTSKGVEVILQTSIGQQLQITNRSAGNNFIADIPNAQLRLPSGDAFTFRSADPIAGITEITVTNFDANTIRVTVTGTTGVPTVELFDSPDEGLIFSVASAASSTQQQEQPQTQPTPEPGKPVRETQPSKPDSEGDEPIELVVTGEQDGYRVRDASTATRTDTPLRDIPQSIQVVPQQVLRDQQATRLEDALRNVSGVTQTSTRSSIRSEFTIRGFNASEFTGNFLRNGLRDNFGSSALNLSNIERVEVLKGPASVLFGGANPGGTINIITKQPLRDSYYSIDATVGNYDFYRGAVDLSGPLNDFRTVLYRLNASYIDQSLFTDFAKVRSLSIAPVVSLELGENTKLTFEGDYLDFEAERGLTGGLPSVGTVLPNPNGRIPRNRSVNEGTSYLQVSRVGYALEHEFSNNWSLLNAFRVGFYRGEDRNLNRNSRLLPDNQTLERTSTDSSVPYDNYNLTTNIVGKFSTGSIKHQLLFGFDLNRLDQQVQSTQRLAGSLNLFNPVYGQPLGSVTSRTDNATLTDTLGVYVQDQVTIAENLKLLLGLRFDTFKQTRDNFIANTKLTQSGDAFTPRVGIVYQPIEPVSLYASYNRSFTPAIGTAFNSGSQFQPERATQYEVGVKADLNDRLSATLALYDLTRSNALVTDNRPSVPSGFSLQTGEQRSRGIELNIAGEILPGWNIIAGYAYTDTEILQDTSFRPGNRLNNVPKNAFNLWTTYEIQQGALQGLGFGLGFFFVGERQGDLGNTFELPSYFRTDAAIFYKQGQFRAAVNFRNLFNVDYFETASSRLSVFPGEPLIVQGTISWQF